jgi:protein-S-isoprenylcysteine O-methyltransferase Ste14
VATIATIQLAVFAVYWAAVTFWPAGAWNYPAGWVLAIVMLASSVLIAIWLARHDPALLRERMNTPWQKGQAGWDRIFMLLLFVFFTAWLAFCSWDASRWGFMLVPLWLQVIGLAGVVFCMFGAWATFRENSFAAPVVKLQEGRKTIDTGPYAIVRRPMYAAALGLFIGAPLLLGSFLGLIGSAVLIAAVTWRSVNEENVLRANLSGYEDYMKRALPLRAGCVVMAP